MDMGRLISKSNQWIVTNYSLIYIVCTSVYCLYALPTFDFRPYHIGANIKKGMEIPEEPINIFIRTWNDNDRLYLSIRDNGQGLL